MNILWFLFGFMVASLVWAAVMVFFCEKDIKDFAELMSIQKEINNITEKQYANMNGTVEEIREICHDISDNNRKFNMSVCDLVEKWGRPYV